VSGRGSIAALGRELETRQVPELLDREPTAPDRLLLIPGGHMAGRCDATRPKRTATGGIHSVRDGNKKPLREGGVRC
jgi:hypothetical protein